jgi:putative phosphoribosyl transferase
MTNPSSRVVEIFLHRTLLDGHLVIPDDPLGLVLFAHGSGSSRFSPRNSFVARVLNEHRIATLLFDLLTSDEDRDYATRFNISLLSQRLADTTCWVRREPGIAALPLGYFGSSTGAAAALRASIAMEDEVRAVVSRGGRPDLVGQDLPRVKCPTLLIVGADDIGVIEMNEMAYRELDVEKELRLIPGATHLFEEPGTLAQVAHTAAQWYERFLPVTHENAVHQ